MGRKSEVRTWVKNVRLGYRQSKGYEGRKKILFKTLKTSNGNWKVRLGDR